MSANLSCYSEKYEQPRIEKIKSIINDVKASIGFATTSLAELSDSPDNLALSPAASEGQVKSQEQAIASSQEASMQVSGSLATTDTSANITSLPGSKSSTTAKREKSPYVLAMGEISYQLCYGENYIGRDQSNHIVIDDYHISRLQALIVVHDNNKVAIFDLGSLNGTFVKEQLIKCTALKIGDRVKLSSNYELTLSLSLAIFGTVIKIKLKDQQIANSSLEQLNQSTDSVISNNTDNASILINTKCN